MLQRGDQGDAVRSLQQTLLHWGIALHDEGGHFGLWTEAAIYLVQRRLGLAADGMVGPETSARLAELPPAAIATPAISRLLPVSYLSQRDNEHRPLATCNVTSLAMALQFHGVSAQHLGKQLEDELFELIHSPAGLSYYETASPELQAKGIPPEDVLDNLVWTAGQRGMNATFSETRTIADIEREVHSGRPAMISGMFTGAGHIVLLIGLCESGDFIVHDPFGDWNRGYKAKDGTSRIYAREKILHVLKPVDRTEKWGLFIAPP
jgi:hypothetical protein